MKVTPGENLHVTFKVKNTGKRAGTEIAQVYASLPTAAGEPPKRLVGWSKVKLNPAEVKEVSVDVEPLFLSVFNAEQHAWELTPGEYSFMVGGSSQSLPLKVASTMK